MVLIETERLQLRHLTEDDAPFIVQLVNTPGWLKYIGDRNIRSDDAAKKYLNEGPIKSYTERGFGLYMVQIKETGTPVGMCGLIKRETLEDVDLGFALMPAYEGKGYAFESAAAVIRYARNELGMKHLLAITVPPNKRSQQLLKGLGFVFVREITAKDESLYLFNKNLDELA